MSILHKHETKHTCMQTLITLAERTVLSITANRKRRRNTITVKCLHTHAVQTADCRVQKSVALSHDQNGTNPTDDHLCGIKDRCNTCAHTYIVS